jgi:hypothetical protein
MSISDLVYHAFVTTLCDVLVGARLRGGRWEHDFESGNLPRRISGADPASKRARVIDWLRGSCPSVSPVTDRRQLPRPVHHVPWRDRGGKTATFIACVADRAQQVPCASSEVLNSDGGCAHARARRFLRGARGLRVVATSWSFWRRKSTQKHLCSRISTTEFAL